MSYLKVNYEIPEIESIKDVEALDSFIRDIIWYSYKHTVHNILESYRQTQVSVSLDKFYKEVVKNGDFHISTYKEGIENLKSPYHGYKGKVDITSGTYRLVITLTNLDFNAFFGVNDES